MRFLRRTRLLRLSILVAALTLPRPGLLAAGAPDPELIIENLTPESEIEQFADKRLWVGRNGVIVRYGDATLTADTVTLNEQTKAVVAEGSVSLRHGTAVWTGDKLEYNFITHSLSGEAFRAGSSPLFVSGMELSGSSGGTNKVAFAKNAFVTTDDLAEPAFKVRARKLKLIVGKRVEAEDATFFVGSVPVFYLPHWSRGFDQSKWFWVVTPGYRSIYGAYSLNEIHYRPGANFDPALRLDYRSRRGAGVGPDVTYDFGRFGQGSAGAYWAHDELPSLDLAGKPVDPDRRRLDFQHSVTLGEGLSAKLSAHEQTDSTFTRDFFEPDYRRDPQPATRLEVSKFWSNFSLDFLAQKQINSFWQTVERLPDVKLSALPQQIGVTPLYYDGESSLGYLKFQPGFAGSTNYGAFRADTYHQITLPQTYFGWLNVAPRLGGRLTHYGETEGVGSSFNERNRSVVNTGMEASFKASRLWSEEKNKFWDLDGLRHIIQPSVNYVYVPRPDSEPSELPQFDQEIPSLRLLPLAYPDYNAIDAIDSQNVIRFGLRNKVQTKRNGEVDNLFSWALLTDWRLTPQAGQQTFQDVYSDFDFKPRRWIVFGSETRYAINDGQFNGANHSITLLPGDNWSWKGGHRFYRGDLAKFGPNSDNNLIYSSWYYKVNENWAFRTSHHFEARDGTMEEQYYTLYRDFRSWTGALTLRLRDNRGNADDFAIAFTFSLKAFPTKGKGRDKDDPSYLLGGY